MIDNDSNTIRVELAITKAAAEIKIYRIIAFIIIVIALISICVFWGLFYLEIGNEYEYLVKIGDLSGGIVSSLFSFAGLILVYVAFLGQKQQLLYQQLEIVYNRIELELTRNEIKGQQKEMKLQNQTLILQNFENIFFQLLSNYQKHINLFYFPEGINQFSFFIEAFKRNNPQKDYSKDNLIKVFNTAQNKYKLDYSFINQIKTILKIIEESKIKNKDFYFNILINILSEYERKCIFLILNFSQNLPIGIEEIFIKHGISGDYKVDEEFYFHNYVDIDD